MLDGLVLSFKIPQRQLGDLEVFWGGIEAIEINLGMLSVSFSNHNEIHQCDMSPQRELGGEQALGHPPTHVGGSWDKALCALGTRRWGLMKTCWYLCNQNGDWQLRQSRFACYL